MEEVSVKVSILGRNYPVTVKPSEEAGLRKAADLVNERTTELQKSYQVPDKQDLLAMAALQIALTASGASAPIDNHNLNEQLQEISTMLDF